jgi:hypothetical protein
VLLVGADHVDAHRLLQLEDQPGVGRLDDGESAALLALNRVVEVPALASSALISAFWSYFVDR